MHYIGVYSIAGALLVLALFPLCVFIFFRLVILDRKSDFLVDDLKSARAFDNTAISQQWKGPEAVRHEMKKLYGYERFLWPVLLLVFFELVCFSIVWDLLRYHFCVQGDGNLFYTAKFLDAAELPMMSFVGVTLFSYGHMIRRLYVWDITTHVFWNTLHRTWLVVAVAAVLCVSLSLARQPDELSTSLWNQPHTAFFALGFIVSQAVYAMVQRAQLYFQIERKRAEDLPLSLVEGISFWHEYRLEEEGIDNVQNLATCDFIDLALATRYNLRTLLDWVDQAVLIHRMGEKAIVLRQKGFISGAIDMAWASPENSGANTIARKVAETTDTDSLYTGMLMNSLFEDTYVRLLWDLWQSDEESRRKSQRRKRATKPRDDKESG